MNVKSAVAVQAAVRTTVTFAEGYGWANIKSLIEDAVDAYLLELRKGWADGQNVIVRVSQVETRVLGVKGVLDVADTTINGSANNLVLAECQVPVLGGVSA